MKNKKSFGMIGDDKSGHKFMNKTPKGKQFSGNQRTSFQTPNQKTPQSQNPVQQRQTPFGKTKGQTAVKEFPRMKGKPSKQNKNNQTCDEDDDDDDDNDSMDDDIDMDSSEEDSDEVDDEEEEDDDEEDEEEEDEEEAIKMDERAAALNASKKMQKLDEKMKNEKIVKTSEIFPKKQFEKTSKLSPKKVISEINKEISDDDDNEDMDCDLDMDDSDDFEDDSDENKSRNVSMASVKKTAKLCGSESNQKNANKKTKKQGNKLNKKNLNEASQKKEDDDEKEDDDDEDEKESQKKSLKAGPSNVNKKMQKQDSEMKTEKTVKPSALESNKDKLEQENPQRTLDCCKLFIAKLPRDIQVDEIKTLSPDIIDVILPSARKGFAFLRFASEAIAEKNFSTLGKQTLRGQAIMVDFAGAKRTSKGPAAQKNENKRINVKKICVFKVPPEITLAEIVSFFPKAGGINFVKCGEFRKANITFEDESDAVEALDKHRVIKISDHILTLKFAKQKRKNKRKRPSQEGSPFAKKMRREQENTSADLSNINSDDDSDD